MSISVAAVLEVCVFRYLQHFSFTFDFWVCKFLLLLRFCDCNIFLLQCISVGFVLHVCVFFHSCVCSVLLMQCVCRITIVWWPLVSGLEPTGSLVNFL